MLKKLCILGIVAASSIAYAAAPDDSTPNGNLPNPTSPGSSGSPPSTPGASSSGGSQSGSSQSGGSSSSGGQQAAAGNKEQFSDTTFARHAAMAGMEEVEMGKLAAQKGSSDAVKKFGQRMVDDHTKANDELKQIASSKNIDLPADSGEDCKRMCEHLNSLDGTAFDTEYMNHMVAGHQKVDAEFKTESEIGKDAELKAFAAKYLPTIEEHLTSAKSIADGAIAKSSSGDQAQPAGSSQNPK